MKFCRDCLTAEHGASYPDTSVSSFHLRHARKKTDGTRARFVNCGSCGFTWVDSVGAKLTLQPLPPSRQLEIDYWRF